MLRMGKQFGDAVERAIGGAAIALTKFAGRLAHAIEQRLVLDHLHPNLAELRAA